jgi:glycosyltransferase involved in cell wall biosynthesis
MTAEGKLLSAVIPAKNLLTNIDNLLRMLSHPMSPRISFILVIDEPNEKAAIVRSRLQKADFLEIEKQLDIKVIYGEFDSPGAARNAGLKEVNSEWITFWDSDDAPIIDSVLKNVELAIKSKSEILVARYSTRSAVNESLKESKPFSTNRLKNLRLIANEPAIWRILFLTKIIENVEFPKLKMGEDQVFISNISLPSRTLHFSNIVTYSYNIHQLGQLTGSKNNLTDLINAFSLNILSLKSISSRSESKFRLQIVSREYLTLVKNGKFLESSLLLVKFMHLKSFIQFIYELAVISFDIIKYRKIDRYV